MDAYQYDAFHRVRFDLNNFTDKIKRSFFLKPFGYIWENTDTTLSGVRYLPVLLTESSERHFYRKTPRINTKVINGLRTFKFFKAPRIMAFVQDMSIDPNIYDNHVMVLDRSFPSPLNNNYKNHYRFYLDTGYHQVNGHSCQRINYAPRNTSDAAFTGEMFIDTTRHAVVRIDLNFSIEANVNFVRSYAIRQTYSLVNKERWFLTKSQILGDFTVIENAKEMTGFFGRRITEISNISIQADLPTSVTSVMQPTLVADSAYSRSEAFWAKAQPTEFSNKEQDLIAMTERMNNDPKWKRLEKGVRLLSTGWVTAGKVDFGNMYTFYSWNNIEGSRVKFGLRTNTAFSKALSIGGYGAYGSSDKRFKGGGDVRYALRGKQGKNISAGGKYRNDLNQLGRSATALPLDHVLTSMVRISGAQKRLDREEYEFNVQRQWWSGTATRLGVFRERFGALERLIPMSNDSSPAFNHEYTSAGVTLTARLWGSSNETLNSSEQLEDADLRKRPAITVDVKLGMKDLLGSQFEHQHYRVGIDHEVQANKAGRLAMLVEGGIVNGQLPFTFLHIPNGNPLVFNDDHSFNLMNYMEFVSDRYVSVQLEHHFDGLLMNRIPGVNKLKLRSFLIGKGYYGTLSSKHRNGAYALAEGMQEMRTPYAEAGFGIENILKIARIDVLWRLTHIDTPGTLRFIVKPSFYFRF